MLFSPISLLGYSILGATLAQAATFEAENGVLTGVTVSTTEAGYSGTGYVVGFDEAADNVAITVTAPTYGVYTLSVRYRAPYGEKKTSLLLNGAGAGEVTLLATTTWSTAAGGKVLLNAGSNTIALQNDWGWYEIDSVTIEPAAAPPPHSANLALVNPNASAEAKALNTYLQNVIYGKKILSGQQELEYITWIETNVGKTPAIAGLDLMDYSPSRVERGTVGHSVEDSITFDARGGIITMLWHWNAPSGLIDIPGKEWWRGFYTDSTTFDVAAALADKTSSDYLLLIRDIDAIAVQLKRLADKKIPLLWRPLHESGSGGWFWWSAKGPAAVKELWRIMYDRLTNYHHVNNLIWVWNSAEADYYPGDDVVDILTYDSYPASGDHGPVSSTYDQLITLGKDKKVVALGEVGSIPDPELLQVYKVDWAWFVTWNGDFINNNVWNPLTFLQKVYTSSYVITLEELGDWKGTKPVTTTTSAASTSVSTSKTTSTTKTTSTSKVTSTTKASTTSTSRITSSTTTTASGPAQTAYGQCGGTNWTGPTKCVSGYKCVYQNAFYSQCVPV